MHARAEAPVNIALIKYWGKRDTCLNLPTNSSLSVTLSTDDDGSDLKLVTETIVVGNNETDTDIFILNEQITPITKRMQSCINNIRGALNENQSYKITSVNYFPTAAGLASSASGLAALTKAISNCTLSLTEESIAARLGSGSACRSIHDGFVLWEKGELSDGSDSFASSIFDHLHWPELRCLVVILSVSVKDISSTNGMQSTVETSTLFSHRLHQIPEKILNLTTAIKQKDFKVFAEIVMKDSNQFHSLCLDTFPPINYLNEKSWQVIRLIHHLNGDGVKAAYTFDAGPNAFVFCLEKDLQMVKQKISTTISDNIIQCSVGKGARLL